MLRSFYRYAILILLAFPIFYVLWMRLSPPLRLSANIWIVYLAIFCSGPLLLIYAFMMRSLWHEKVLALIALLIGGPWVGFEIILIIRTIL